MSEPDDYDCPRCDGSHPVSTDTDGYQLAFCPKRGTTLVARPGDDR